MMRKARQVPGLFKGVKKTVVAISKRFEETHLFLYTAQTTYYVIFSSIPLVMLTIMFWRWLFPEMADIAIDLLQTAMPELTGRLPDDFWDSVLSFDAPVFSLTLIMMVWSASKWAKSLSSGLCTIYGSAGKRNFIMRYVFSWFYTLVFIMFVLTALGVMLYGNVFYSRVMASGAGVIGVFVRLKGIILSLILSFFAALVYKHMGNTDYKFGELLPGAVFTAVGWSVYSSVFSLYIRYYSDYSILYGSIGIILVLMLWVYNCVMILFLGAELNVYIKKRPIIIT